MDYNPWFLARNCTFLLWPKGIPSEKASHEEVNGANFSYIAPSSEGYMGAERNRKLKSKPWTLVHCFGQNLKITQCTTPGECGPIRGDALPRELLAPGAHSSHRRPPEAHRQCQQGADVLREQGHHCHMQVSAGTHNIESWCLYVRHRGII